MIRYFISGLLRSCDRASQHSMLAPCHLHYVGIQASAGISLLSEANQLGKETLSRALRLQAHCATIMFLSNARTGVMGQPAAGIWRVRADHRQETDRTREILC
jgi:hypothetical protein